MAVAISALAALSRVAFAGGEESIWMPEQASSFAPDVDRAWDFFYWVSVVFLVLITVLVVWFTIRYGKAKGGKPEGNVHHNTPLELTWTIIPTILVVIMFYMGYTGYVDMRTPPGDVYEVTVTGQKWKWLFEYKNGHVDEKLHVPAHTNVKLTIKSEDVLHSVYIPAFRVKQDAVPGRYTFVWFRAKNVGEYHFFCTEYCGTGHSDMITWCVVHPKEGFDTWLANADPLKRMTDEQYQQYREDPDTFKAKNPDFADLEIPAVVGRNLYDKWGCKQCHSLDGSRIIGPTFKGLWGATREFEKGEPVKADENYVRDSILNPQDRIVKTYDNAMPTFKGRLKDREIYCIIEFLKTLADKPQKGSK